MVMAAGHCRYLLLFTWRRTEPVRSAQTSILLQTKLRQNWSCVQQIHNKIARENNVATVKRQFNLRDFICRLMFIFTSLVLEAELSNLAIL
jgi:hypothetical protein